MLYICQNKKTLPVVDMLLDELQIYNMNKAKINMLAMAKKFNAEYNELTLRCQNAEVRIANYKKMLGESNMTVGDFKPETL